MTPIIYKSAKDGTIDYSDAGAGFLSDALTGTINEVLNGQFVLNMTYPATGIHADELRENNAIKVDYGTQLKQQIFIIKQVTPNLEGIYTVYAEHISYLTLDLGMKPTTALTGTAQQALNFWDKQLIENGNLFTLYSDKTDSETVSLGMPDFDNAREALGGKEGSILDKFGGEYKFDNYKISLLKQRGKASGATIRYGKNLTAFTHETDLTGVYTSIIPYANIDNGNDNQTTHYLTPLYLDCDNVDIFPHRVFQNVDFSESFGTEAGQVAYSDSALKNLAIAYMKNNDFGKPKITIDINTVDLSKSLDKQPSDNIELGDTVNVYFEQYGINTTAECTEVTYDFLSEQYTAYTFGTRAETLGDQLAKATSDNTSAINKVVEQVNHITDSNGHTDFYISSDQDKPQGQQDGDTLFIENGADIEIDTWTKGTDGTYAWVQKVVTNANDQIQKNKPYIHIAYADDEQGGGFSLDPTNKKYLGTYTDNLPAVSTDPTKYTWVLVKGTDGVDGTDITAITYGTTAPTNPKEGAIWFDTSTSPMSAKIFHDGGWIDDIDTATNQRIADLKTQIDNELSDTKKDIVNQYSSINKVVNTEFDTHIDQKKVVTPQMSVPTPNAKGWPDQIIIGRNYLLHSDFPVGTGLNGWLIGKNSTAIIDTLNKYNGNNSIKFSQSIAGANDDTRLGIEPQAVTLGNVIVGKIVKLGFFAKADSPVTLQAYARQWNGSQQFNLTTDWQYFEITFTGSADSSNYDFKLALMTAGINAYLNSVFIVQDTNVKGWSPAPEDTGTTWKDTIIHDPVDGTYSIKGKITTPYTNYIQDYGSWLTINNNSQGLVRNLSLTQTLKNGSKYTVAFDYYADESEGTLSAKTSGGDVILTNGANQTDSSHVHLDFTATADFNALTFTVVGISVGNAVIVRNIRVIDSRNIEVFDSSNNKVQSATFSNPGFMYNTDKTLSSDIGGYNSIQHDNDNKTDQISGGIVVNETTLTVKDDKNNTVKQIQHLGTQNLILDSEMLNGLQSSSQFGWNAGDSNISILTGAGHNGKNALQIKKTNTAASVAVSGNFDVKLGSKYFWSVWYKITSTLSQPANIYIEGRDGTGAGSEKEDAVQTNTSAGGWTQIKGSYIPTNSATAILRLRFENLGTGTILFSEPMLNYGESVAPYIADTDTVSSYSYSLPQDGRTYRQILASDYIKYHHNYVLNSELLNNGTGWTHANDNWTVLSDPDQQFNGHNVFDYQDTSNDVDHVRSSRIANNVSEAGWWTTQLTYRFLSDIRTNSSAYYHLTVSLWNADNTRIQYADINLDTTKTDWTVITAQMQVNTDVDYISIETALNGSAHLQFTMPALYPNNDDMNSVLYYPDSDPLVATTQITTNTPIDRQDFELTMPADSGNYTLSVGSQGNYPFTVQQNRWPIAFDGITISGDGTFSGVAQEAGAAIYASNANGDTYSTYADANSKYVLPTSTTGEVLQVHYEYYVPITVISFWKDNVDNNFDAQKAVVVDEQYSNSKVLEIQASNQQVALDCQEIYVYPQTAIASALAIKVIAGQATIYIKAYDSSNNFLANISTVANITASSWTLEKLENLKTPANTDHIILEILCPSGSTVRISQPTLVFASTYSGYTVGTGVTSKSILGLYDKDFALGLFNNSGAIISGINGTANAFKITGEHILLNGDTAVTGDFFANNADIINLKADQITSGTLNAGIEFAGKIDVDQLSGNISRFVNSYWEDPYKDSISISGSQIILSNPNNDSQLMVSSSGIFANGGGLSIAPRSGGHYGINVTKWGDYTGAKTNSLGAYIGTYNQNNDGFIAFTGNGIGTTLLWADSAMNVGKQPAKTGAWNLYAPLAFGDANTYIARSGNASLNFYTSLDHFYMNKKLQVTGTQYPSLLSKKNILENDLTPEIALSEFDKMDVEKFEYKEAPGVYQYGPIIDDVNDVKRFYIPEQIHNDFGVDNMNEIGFLMLVIKGLKKELDSLKNAQA